MTRRRPTPLETLASNIARYRESANLSQQELAFRTGLSISTIQRLESGQKISPSFTTLCQLSKAFGIKLVHLVEGI